MLKTIAAFLNTEGGTLLIGVEDQGGISGLECDLHWLNDSEDSFSQLLNTIMFQQLGAGAVPYIRQRFEAVDGHKVCVVDVDRSAEPVFAKSDKGREFFIRVGNTTRALDPEETMKYIESRGSGA